MKVERGRGVEWSRDARGRVQVKRHTVLGLARLGRQILVSETNIWRPRASTAAVATNNNKLRTPPNLFLCVRAQQSDARQLPVLIIHAYFPHYNPPPPSHCGRSHLRVACVPLYLVSRTAPLGPPPATFTFLSPCAVLQLQRVRGGAPAVPSRAPAAPAVARTRARTCAYSRRMCTQYYPAPSSARHHLLSCCFFFLRGYHIVQQSIGMHGAI